MLILHIHTAWNWATFSSNEEAELFPTNFTNISKPRILTIPFTVAVASDIFVSGHILLNGILSTDCYLDKKRDLRNISELHIFALIMWPSPMATHLGDVVAIVSRGLLATESGLSAWPMTGQSVSANERISQTGGPLQRRELPQRCLPSGVLPTI